LELIYVYIENYKAIKQKGFLFNRNFIEELDIENRTFSIKKRSDVNNSFNKIKVVLKENSQKINIDNIKNITGIVGENGTFKSTLIDYIFKFIMTSNEFYYLDYFFIFYEEENDKLYYTEEHEKERPFVFSDNINKQNNNKNFNEPFVINYTSILNVVDDFYISENIAHNKFNISTNSCMINDSLKRSSSKHNMINDHYFREIERELFFFKDYQEFDEMLNLEGEVKIPKYLFVSINFDVMVSRIKEKLIFLKNKKEKGKENKVPSVKILNEYLEIIKKDNSLININDKKNLFKAHLFYSLFGYCLLSLDENKLFEISDFNGLEVFYKNVQIDYNIFEEILSYIFKNFFTSEYRKKINIFYKCVMKELDSLSEEGEMKLLYSNPVFLKLNISDKGKQFELIGNYFEVIDLFPVLNLKWAEENNTIISLSSGEKALYSLFGRFYEVKKEIKNIESSSNLNHGNNIIILLDEPDIFLHPEWQRKFLYIFTRFVSEVFKEFKIQIIFTTHSPLMISDLPSENILFFKKEKEEEKNKNNYKVVSKSKTNNDSNKEIDTFCAPIYSLYRESFFLEAPVIGKIAKEYIDCLIKKIEELNNKKSVNGKLKSEIMEQIEIIKEPIIKNKLQNMFESKIFSLNWRNNDQNSQ